VNIIIIIINFIFSKIVFNFKKICNKKKQFKELLLNIKIFLEKFYKFLLSKNNSHSNETLRWQILHVFKLRRRIFLVIFIALQILRESKQEHLLKLLLLNNSLFYIIFGFYKTFYF